ncbi:hypothetical protein [Runella aurantiaca]|uniref:ATP-binding protein n=1 Tax=Runella aurantiaca TaxID=2282308 RepID=A0A369I3K0_9BACT|nr:hypothetical protein [Runella aurantiaca]RDB03490.1 hypothetical protein DVG78_23540 [Runella aurantiaca]
MQKHYKLAPTVGTIPPDKVVGRLTEIEELYKLTESQSVVLSEIRRMGKTLFLQKFAYVTVKENRLNKAIHFDLMQVVDVTELTDNLLDKLRSKENYGWLKVQLERCRLLYNKFKPEKIDVKLPQLPELSFKLPEFKTEWKKALSACIEDLADRNHQENESLTLILDEMPYMLWQWILNGKAQDAIELLSLLRSLRQSLQDKGRIRFVICGSVGLEVVLNHLRTEFRYTAEPFNDAAKYSLEAMNDSDAVFLSECLALSGFTFTENKEEAINAICQVTENLPFYINKLFAILQNSFDSKISRNTVYQAFDELLTNVDQDSTFEQLDTRISTYYPKQADIMFKVLNYLSKKGTITSEDEIKESLEADDKAIQEVLRLLTKDQYLRRVIENETRSYRFKYKLIQQWWKLNKA